MCVLIHMNGGCWMVHPELTIQKEKLATEKYNLAVFIHWQLKKNWFDGRMCFYRYLTFLLHIADQVFVAVLHIVFFLFFVSHSLFHCHQLYWMKSSSESYYSKGSAFLPRQQYSGTESQRHMPRMKFFFFFPNGSIYGW